MATELPSLATVRKIIRADREGHFRALALEHAQMPHGAPAARMVRPLQTDVERLPGPALACPVPRRGGSEERNAV